MRTFPVALICAAASLFAASAGAEDLPDPTRPPALLAAPGAAEAQPAGLQSIIISKTRRAAIIDGETVELRGKHGDAKLIKVDEGSVVLQGPQGRQVLTLFPEVKMAVRKAPAGKAQPDRQKSVPAASKEKR
ncbi:MAG: hypothetical protein A2Z95_03155 [Gallionellales bacterium GWA2_60_18]|nr:MAG: hypothetical protein A2Z95_03155 [Gallionellales bacterium GWA2_60_18]